ncbi:MBOAT family protein [Microcoleus sp. FACHB-1515]|uniref:MBOAT family O-acyltransferase n=1 Tax=Cyanophyceae TaxID=3028117 RepID=UPI0016855250|nr:MBOAT family protein [Microcoleus sp. FACHB-1515]MBD2089865.1 MBOAT family protein [Microcoleus sp. FACHB-1515]
MTLLSIVYGLFLLSVLGLYWAIESQSLRLWILAIASLIFYSSLQVEYIPLLLAMIWVTFRLGQALNTPIDWRIGNDAWQFAQQDWNRRRLWLLSFGIMANVLLLLGFKYVPFLLESIGELLKLPQLQTQATWVSDRLIAPLGISFFCFECIAYLIDVYRGAPATESLLKFSAYKLFFPKLISGPITRFHPFAAQLSNLKFPASPQIAEALWLIAVGAVKKLLIADHLGTAVNLIYGNVDRAGSGDLWIAAIAYGFQLYLDFSGYVDVARGSALLLGFALPQNFDFPYFSTSIADFWRRWHMTLGDWLRNYLYFPLGGSRRGLFRTCLNLLIVMLIAGIWHGAAWGFVVWGAVHGFALILHRLTDAISSRWKLLQIWWDSLPGTLLAWMLTQAFVFTAWISFRLPSLQDTLLVLQRLWGHAADVQFAQKVYVETLRVDRLQFAALLGLLVLGMGASYLVHRVKLKLNWPLKLLLVPLCLFAAWLLAPNQSQPYIYFDF